MLVLNDLEIGYQSRSLARLPTTMLSAGEFVCLLGRNGQGKSTLLRTLAGFLPARSGDAHIDGRALRAWRPAERARTIAVVLTDRPELGPLSVTELVELGRQPFTGWTGALSPKDRRIAADALEIVGGRHLADRRVDDLSDGERQRAMIARALAQQPRLMLLDEITAFLDLPSRVTIIDTLRRIARDQGVAIVLSSHDLELSLQTADRLWLLPGEGRFIDGTPEDVALSGAIGAAFDQDNLVFSRASGRFETPATDGRTVHLDASGVGAAWMARALRRRGLSVVTQGPASHHLALSQNGALSSWRLDGGDALPRIEDVLRRIDLVAAGGDAPQ